LLAPLSKRFTDIQREELYRYINIRAYSRFTKLEKLFAIVLDQPQFGSLVSSFRFHFDDSAANTRNSAPVVILDAVQDVFRLFTNLTTLQITGEATKRCPSLLEVLNPSTLSSKLTRISISLGPGQDHTLLSLPPQLESLDVALSYAYRGSPSLRSSPPRTFAQLSTLTLSDAALHSKACESFIALCPNLQSLHLVDVVPPSTADAVLKSISSPSQIKTLTVMRKSRREDRLGYRLPIISSSQLSKFTNLKDLTLGGNCTSYSQALVDAIRSLPLENLILEESELVPPPSLLALVSPPTQHPTLRSLVLNLIDKWIKIGTRVAEVNFDHAFSQMDPDSKVVEEDAMTDDWKLPKFPSGFSLEGLIKLQTKGAENGVAVVGRVYEGIVIQRAYDDDVEALEELWKEWKKRGKKSKQSGKSRKSKK